MSKVIAKQLSQAERRELTRAQLLQGAEELFGQHGYAQCSLEQIASHCGLTIGAIYHHFGNKKALFAAVNEAAEQRVVDGLRAHGTDEPLEYWRAFLRQSANPGFRRIVLVDAPNVLGRERWMSGPLATFATRRMRYFEGAGGQADYTTPLFGRMLRGAMTEAALAIAESGGDAVLLEQAERFIGTMLDALLPRH